MINIAPNVIQSFSKIFNGAKTRHGKLTYHDKDTGEKSCCEIKQPIPIADHLNNKEYLGAFFSITKEQYDIRKEENMMRDYVAEAHENGHPYNVRG